MVNKDALLSKLLRYGILGRMFRFIHSFLSNRTFQVRLGSTLSLTKHLVENGTQGSVLSPILFTLMINDLQERITSPAALYADDFCFWECGSDITLLNQLCQRSLFSVQLVWRMWVQNLWHQICGGTIHKETRSSTHFLDSAGRYPPTNAARIPVLRNPKLGLLTFQRNGSFSKHVQNVAAKCRARLNVIRMLKGTSWGAGKRSLLTVCRSLVRSVIEYGMEAYFFTSPSLLKHYTGSKMMHCVYVLEPWPALHWSAYITLAMKCLYSLSTSSCV